MLMWSIFGIVEPMRVTMHELVALASCRYISFPNPGI